jgi:MoaA/NifB/PqqE/SkfB family radical SAM enzyme
LAVAGAIVSHPRIAFAGLSMNLFLLEYLRKFKIRNVGGNLIIHSHLPPINSRAYSRFIREHLLDKTPGPSHAQVGLTNLCPQKCRYCYNRERTGTAMTAETIMRLISDLKKMGVFWLGLTGGEPLLNKDIVRITESAADGCAVKLFTTGCHLSRDLARDLKSAGLFSVAVSLDHWSEDIHDQVRGYKGAYKTALKAIEIFKGVNGLHVSVSAVLSPEMIKNNRVEEYLEFLGGLGIDEAWISETKPSVEPFWRRDLIITEKERRDLMALQDRHNRAGRMTVNYLAHFESAEHFGCSAGHKMVYIDSFGDVSPCVFTPINFGNVNQKPIRRIFADMRKHFPSDNTCFINKNFEAVRHIGHVPLNRYETVRMLEGIKFGPLAEFYRLYYKPCRRPW